MKFKIGELVKVFFFKGTIVEYLPATQQYKIALKVGFLMAKEDQMELTDETED